MFPVCSLVNGPRLQHSTYQLPWRCCVKTACIFHSCNRRSLGTTCLLLFFGRWAGRRVATKHLRTIPTTDSIWSSTSSEKSPHQVPRRRASPLCDLSTPVTRRQQSVSYGAQNADVEHVDGSVMNHPIGHLTLVRVCPPPGSASALEETRRRAGESSTPSQRAAYRLSRRTESASSLS